MALALVLAIVAYRATTKEHHEANPVSDDAVYEEIARGLWVGELPPGDFSPGLALYFATFANPWVASEPAFAWARGVLALLLAFFTQRALRVRAGPVVACVAAVWIAASPIPFSRFLVRPAAALVLAVALAVAARGRPVVAACLLSAGAWVRPELGLAGLVLACVWIVLAPAIERGAAWRGALACALLVASLVAYGTYAESRYEDRLFRAFAQHYAWGAEERGEFDGDPWSGWRPLVSEEFGQRTNDVPGALRASPRAFALHLAHNVQALPGEALSSLAPLRSRLGRWSTLGLIAAVLLAVLRRGMADTRRRALARLVRVNRVPLWVCAAAACMLGPWLLVHPRADVLFTLAPAALFLLGMGACYAFRAADADSGERGAG